MREHSGCIRSFGSQGIAYSLGWFSTFAGGVYCGS